MDVTNPYAALEQGADDEVNGRTFWLKWFGVLGGYVSFTTLVMAATMQIVWNFIIRPSDYDDCMDNYRASESLAKALGLPNRATDCHQFRYEQWWSFHPVGFESWVGLVIIGLFVAAISVIGLTALEDELTGETSFAWLLDTFYRRRTRTVSVGTHL
jgi:RimJ/RimL family protein N-acetyltransferase